MKKTLTVPSNWRSMGKLETQKACDLSVDDLAYLLANRLEQTTGQLSEDALFQLQGALDLAVKKTNVIKADFAPAKRRAPCRTQSHHRRSLIN